MHSVEGSPPTSGWKSKNLQLDSGMTFDKVRMYEEIMTNDDNLESNLLTSSLLKMLVQVEHLYCLVTGGELRIYVQEI